MTRRPLLIAAALLASVTALAARPSTAPPGTAGQAAPARSLAVTGRTALTVETIMKGPSLVGYPPSALRWAADSSELYFEWRKPGEEEASTYAVGREGGEPRKLSDEARKKVPPRAGQWDAARRRVLFAEGGDIALLDTGTGTRVQITRTTGAESNPRWARGETAVTFVRDGNLFLVPLASGVIEQLTDVQPRKRETRETESQKYLKDEEQKLIEFTRRAGEKRKQAEEKRKKEALPVFEIQEGQSVTDLALSPGGDHVFLVVTQRPAGAKTADTPNYVTESSYTEMIPGRSNVGDAQAGRRLAILNLATGKSVWADSSFAGKQPRPQPAGQDGEKGDKREVEREVSWSMPLLPKEGVLAVAWVRSADFKDRWIVVVDPESGKARVVDAQHDEGWVLERGFGAGNSGFLPDDKRIYFTSEKDGWMHVHVIDASVPDARATSLTRGPWEVSSVELSPDRTRFYFISSERHPGERHLYTMSIEGGEWTQVTSMTGSHACEVSPDDRTIGMVYSYSNKPPEVYVMPNQKGAAARQVTTTPTEEWRSFKWADPQVITFKARDGVDVHARLYTPEMLGARRDPTRPGVVFVHGAGYTQNVHKWWSSYYREYMFHNLLASRGYVVLDVDYRASAGYGRDWRTAIYRHMGGKDLADIVDGAKYLASAHRVDSRRIGVYGGSYGGFITLMALFTAPDTFAAGAALRPVTDWAHYNHSYTASILNQPQEDREAYRRSSPIYFAEGLKGALLICHGMVDTNVHFQDSVRLAQRLIELRKDNWELAVYPVENHGFEQETSWVDEYKRILNLFERNLRRKQG
ncbi:MAG TPA: prolyl oligopeptidase family serine peptidase [Vicinamibacterales bacterium]|nr:prolyl oligopeptidase family serine peptidase [Vicinamibacterales bacterium]